MTVSRDVIYDLLPAYFSGDASADSRQLVEEFLATDPELRKMAEHFGKLMSGAAAAPPTQADREKMAFHRARSRIKLRLAALGWAFGAIFSYGMALLTPAAGRFPHGHPGIIIGVVFTVAAMVMVLMSFSARPEQMYAAFTGNEKDVRPS